MEERTARKLRARELLEHAIQNELDLSDRNQFGKAFLDYRRAAMLGDHQAQFFLALHYASGLCGHKNHRLALAWFKKAAYAGESLCTLVSQREGATAEELIRLFGKLLH